MKSFGLVLVFLVLCAPLLADDVTTRTRVFDLASSSGTVYTSASPLTITSGTIGYLYPERNDIRKAGIFSAEIVFGGDSSPDLDVSMQVALDETYSAASSTVSTSWDVTTTGTYGPAKLDADTPGILARVKIINVGDEAVTVYGKFGSR